MNKYYALNKFGCNCNTGSCTALIHECVCNFIYTKKQCHSLMHKCICTLKCLHPGYHECCCLSKYCDNSKCRALVHNCKCHINPISCISVIHNCSCNPNKQNENNNPEKCRKSQEHNCSCKNYTIEKCKHKFCFKKYNKSLISCELNNKIL